MSGNKGFVYTADVVIFVVVFLLILTFVSTITTLNTSTKNMSYNSDLTFKEANSFMTGKSVNETNQFKDKSWYLCRDALRFNSQGNMDTPSRVCIGGK